MAHWIHQNIPPWAVIALVVHLSVLGAVAYMILLERKIASWVQDRIGPNRVGLGFGIIPGLKDFHFWGLGQPLADGLKFILKEDYRPAGVDKYLFTLAPAIMIVTVIISIATIPWGGVMQSTVAGAAPWWATVVSSANGATTYQWPFQIANLNIGVLFILATLSLAVYGVVIGGWASNNKYSFLGGLRATANMISYELPLGLSVLAICIMYGTLDLGVLVDKQATYWAGFVPAWNVFTQPLAFLMFLICIHAEANRAPFDLAEAEQELVGGYHTEYSSMRFALFFLAEYAGMVTTSAVCVAMFFGGWHLPWIDKIWPALGGGVDPAHPALTDSLLACIVRATVFFGKTIGIIFVFMWVRWSLPRFRFDQLMGLAWRSLIPIALIQLLATAVLVWWWGGEGRAFMRVGGKMAIALLVMNVALLAVFVIGSRLLPKSPDTNRRVRVAGSRFAAAVS